MYLKVKPQNPISLEGLSEFISLNKENDCDDGVSQRSQPLTCSTMTKYKSNKLARGKNNYLKGSPILSNHEITKLNEILMCNKNSNVYSPTNFETSSRSALLTTQDQPSSPVLSSNTSFSIKAGCVKSKHFVKPTHRNPLSEVDSTNIQNVLRNKVNSKLPLRYTSPRLPKSLKRLKKKTNSTKLCSNNNSHNKSQKRTHLQSSKKFHNEENEIVKINENTIKNHNKSQKCTHLQSSKKFHNEENEIVKINENTIKNLNLTSYNNNFLESHPNKRQKMTVSEKVTTEIFQIPNKHTSGVELKMNLAIEEEDSTKRIKSSPVLTTNKQLIESPETDVNNVTHRNYSTKLISDVPHEDLDEALSPVLHSSHYRKFISVIDQNRRSNKSLLSVPYEDIYEPLSPVLDSSQHKKNRPVPKIDQQSQKTTPEQLSPVLGPSKSMALKSDIYKNQFNFKKFPITPSNCHFTVEEPLSPVLDNNLNMKRLSSVEAAVNKTQEEDTSYYGNTASLKRKSFSSVKYNDLAINSFCVNKGSNINVDNIKPTLNLFQNINAPLSSYLNLNQCNDQALNHKNIVNEPISCQAHNVNEITNINKNSKNTITSLGFWEINKDKKILNIQGLNKETNLMSHQEMEPPSPVLNANMNLNCFSKRLQHENLNQSSFSEINNPHNMVGNKQNKKELPKMMQIEKCKTSVNISESIINEANYNVSQNSICPDSPILDSSYFKQNSFGKSLEKKLILNGDDLQIHPLSLVQKVNKCSTVDKNIKKDFSLTHLISVHTPRKNRVSDVSEDLLASSNICCTDIISQSTPTREKPQRRHHMAESSPIFQQSQNPEINHSSGSCRKHALSPLLDFEQDDDRSLLGPMLGSELKHNESCNVLPDFNEVASNVSVASGSCGNANNIKFNEEKSIEHSPSFDSELDIRRFPIDLSQIEESNDLNDRRNQELHVYNLTGNSKLEDKITDIEQHSYKYGTKNHCKSLLDGVHEKTESNDFTHKTIVSERGSAKDCESDGEENKSTKRTIKKNLNLLYDTQPLTTVKEKHTCCDGNEVADTNVEDELIISGVEKLNESSFEHNDGDKSKVAVRCGSDMVACSQLPSNTCQQDKNNMYKNKKTFHRNVNTHGESQLWKDHLESFETSREVVIEDFDEESCDKTSVEIMKLDSVKRNLNNDFDENKQPTVISMITETPKVFGPVNSAETPKLTGKPAKLSNSNVHDVRTFLLNFETSETLCDNVSSPESNHELNIQEIVSQESLKPQDFTIECSTSPSKKSSEGVQHDQGSGAVSYAPAVHVPVADDLDSACKTRKMRPKKGSLVERLRRLVGAVRAEVNMFQHEGPAQGSARVCCLRVDSVVKTCSRLMLSCRHTDTYRSCSEEFSVGEEMVDPEVRVFVDPLYAKSITNGHLVLIYPPWSSIWLDEQNLMVMYCVTKLQNVTCSPTVSLPPPPTVAATLIGQFNCQTQYANCCCRLELMRQLFNQQEVSAEHSWAEDSIMAALAGGRYPHSVKLRLSVLHTFRLRSRNNRVLTSMLCVDTNNHVCQLNLRSAEDEVKLSSLLKGSDTKTLVLDKLTICKRIHIDRSRGLRSLVHQLHRDSVDQQLMYVVTPASPQWSVQPSSTALLSTCDLAELPPLVDLETCEGRVSASVRVMALRGDALYVWDKRLDTYYKIHITPSAVLPDFAVRSYLHILYLWAHTGQLTIDKFSIVTVVEGYSEDFEPAVPHLTLNSDEGDLVHLDSIVTKVNSELCLRWVGACGHRLLKARHTGFYYCTDCKEAVSVCQQQLSLEVCVVVTGLPAPIRVKVKSETAQIFLLGNTGEISSEKSYNMIGIIGASLKCLAVVLEVLKNPFGDVLEFLLEEL